MGPVERVARQGAQSHDEQLAIYLTNTEYGFNLHDQIQLERKESMRARGLASPDDADALAVTFAFPVPIEMIGMTMPTTTQDDRDYVPMALMATGHDSYSGVT
ncbi:MAG: hypothetical protein ABI771_10210 [Betaproteobacteria bacterium]